MIGNLDRYYETCEMLENSEQERSWHGGKMIQIVTSFYVK